MKRGDIYLINLDPAIGSETNKTRPGIIVQNDVGNTYSPSTIVVPLTTNVNKIYPTDAQIDENSKALCNQVRTVDKKRLIKKLGSVKDMKQINRALEISLGLVEI